MRTVLMALVALHVLTAVFWAGSTFALARTGAIGAGTLFRPQMGAASLAVLTGIGLWSLLHGGAFGPPEKVLALGILSAIAAAGVQGALRAKPERSQRIAAGLLTITVVCMATARYVG